MISVALTGRGRAHRRARRRSIFCLVGSRVTPLLSWMAAISRAAINGYLAQAIECYGSGEEARWPRCISLLCRTSRCNYLLSEEESIWNDEQRCISIPRTEPSFIPASFFHLKAHASIYPC